jgi:hypothetical protein
MVIYDASIMSSETGGKHESHSQSKSVQAIEQIIVQYNPTLARIYLYVLPLVFHDAIIMRIISRVVRITRKIQVKSY